MPIGAGLGTAELGRPIKCTDLYPGDPMVDTRMWAWPLKDPQPFRRPIAALGARQFWNWPGAGVEP